MGSIVWKSLLELILLNRFVCFVKKLKTSHTSSSQPSKTYFTKIGPKVKEMQFAEKDLTRKTFKTRINFRISDFQGRTETSFCSTYSCLVVVDEPVSARPAKELDRALSNFVLDSSGHRNRPGPAGDDYVGKAEALGHRWRHRRRRRERSAALRSRRHYSSSRFFFSNFAALAKEKTDLGFGITFLCVKADFNVWSDCTF